MSKAKMEIDVENAKAREQAEQKRLMGLAKQTAIGLANIGVKYEMTSIANILRVAFRCGWLGDQVERDENFWFAREFPR